MSNPRNAYQRYNAAGNSGDRVLHTYMGKLLPGCGNINFSGAGELSPLMNDPESADHRHRHAHLPGRRHRLRHRLRHPAQPRRTVSPP